MPVLHLTQLCYRPYLFETSDAKSLPNVILLHMSRAFQRLPAIMQSEETQIGCIHSHISHFRNVFNCWSASISKVAQNFLTVCSYCCRCSPLTFRIVSPEHLTPVFFLMASQAVVFAANCLRIGSSLAQRE